jgi:hypothetical protein
MSPRVIGYTWSADVHCIACTRAAHVAGAFERDVLPERDDENGIPENARDAEGNPLHPIFSTDEFPEDGEFCGDCFERIA